MNKSRNKGVSFLELVVAVAIFGILIIPITSQLISALKTSDKSAEAQNKYEFAENLMENVKNSDSVAFFSDDVVNDTYLKKISKSGTVSKLPTQGMYSGEVSGTYGKANYDGCILTGATEVGKGKRKQTYYYAIEMNNKKYAQKQVEENTYSNPNDASLALIESLDSSKVALINGTIGNYDMTVTNAYMSRKLDLLKVGDKTRWEQYTKQQAEIVAFPNDTVTRVIEVAVSSKKSQTYNTDKKMEYTVTCKLRYKDNSNVKLKEGPHKGTELKMLLNEIDYIPYTQTFVAKELPNIYLMYNPCMYNGNYMADDYILLDTSGLSKQEVNVLDRNGKVVQENNANKTENAYPQVNLFVVETAERYSDQAAASYALVEVAQEYAEEEVVKEAKKEATRTADTAGNRDTDEWKIAYDKAYPEEYNKQKDKWYDKKYSEAYKDVSDAVSKNTAGSWKDKYTAALTKIKDENLTNTNVIRSRSRTKIHFIGRKNSDVAFKDLNLTKYVHIYHNFPDESYSDADKRTPVQNAQFDSQDPITKDVTDLYQISNVDDPDTSGQDGKEDIDENQFKYITDAITSANPLYEVKIYMSENKIAESNESYSSLLNKLDKLTPILSGSKGGN